ncbi:MAG: hypothetical protein ACLPXB_14080 [Thiobacillaceae bacterium]
MTLSPRNAGEIALRLLIGLPILLLAAWYWGSYYVHVFLPLYREVLSVVLSGIDIKPFGIIREHEYRLIAPYVVEAMQVIHGHVISRNLDGSVQAPIYYALIHPIMLSVAALAWPSLSWKGRVARLLISLPILVVLEAVDIPLVIYSSINEILAQTYDPNYLIAKPVDWVRVLEGGGRFALRIAGAVVAAELHKVMNGLATCTVRPAV